MADEMFNGWKNKATHDVQYFISSDSDLNRDVRELTAQFKAEQELATALEDYFQAEIGDKCPFDESDISILRRELVGDALELVDWLAIARQRIVISR